METNFTFIYGKFNKNKLDKKKDNKAYTSVPHQVARSGRLRQLTQAVLTWQDLDDSRKGKSRFISACQSIENIMLAKGQIKGIKSWHSKQLTFPLKHTNKILNHQQSILYYLGFKFINS